MKAWTSLCRYIRVLNVALIATSSAVAFAQSGYDISFGSVPAFFTGTGNTLNLHVHTYSPNRINRIEVSIGGVEVFDEQWSWNDNKVHRPVDVDWSSEYFSHGTNVAYTAVVTLWTSSTTTQVLNFSTTAKPVYNKYSVFADSSLEATPAEAAMVAGFLSNLDYAEQAVVVSDEWERDDFTSTSSGIGYATVIHATCHGGYANGEGFVAPPISPPYVTVANAEAAVLSGQPTYRPPVNFAFISTCCTFQDADFGDALLSGSSNVQNRAAIGFRFSVGEVSSAQFAEKLYGKMKDGWALRKAAEFAFQQTSWSEEHETVDDILLIVGGDGYKLRGAFRGLGGDDTFNDWVFVYPEDN